MSTNRYAESLKKRVSVLFSPLRLVLWAGSAAWAIALNIVYIAGEGEPSWAGPASVVPLFAMLIWLFVTDSRHRRVRG